MDFDVKTSNTIFDIFQSWEAYLKAENINIPKLLQEFESEDALSQDLPSEVTDKQDTPVLDRPVTILRGPSR